MRNVLGFCLFLIAAGCNPVSSDRVSVTKPAKFDADQVARSAMAKLDRNGNGVIDLDEAQVCPGLADAFNSIDTDQANSLSLQKLTERFQKYQTPLNGKVPLCVYVTLDGAPLAGAKVRFIPESFFEGVLRVATGETNADGRCREFVIDGQHYFGLSAGLYKITVEGGNIPSRYNAASTLGSEVFTTGRGGEVAIHLALTAQ